MTKELSTNGVPEPSLLAGVEQAARDQTVLSTTTAGQGPAERSSV